MRLNEHNLRRGGKRADLSDYGYEGVIWRLSRVGRWLAAIVHEQAPGRSPSGCIAHWLELSLASQRCVPRGAGAVRIHRVVVNSGPRTQRRSQVYRRKMCARIGILSQREGGREIESVCV